MDSHDDDLNDAESLREVLDGAATAAAADLMADATNLLGDRLRPETRGRILALLANPSPDTWDDAHSIILNGSRGMGLTMWQAMIGVDETCPVSGAPYTPDTTPLTPEQRWDGYAPDPFLVLAALQAAIAP